MRLILEITVTSEGRYKGHVTAPGSDPQRFAGILGLLEILEQLPLTEHQGAAPADKQGRGEDRARE